MGNNLEKYTLKENERRRKIFTKIGIILTVLGLLFILIALIDFFVSSNNMEQPSLFFLSFLGMPLLFTGIVFLLSFNQGRIARFYASQTAPVAKDVTNYILDGTKESIGSVAKEIKENISDTKDSNKITERACLKCGAINPIDNKYCGNCGSKMPE